MTDSKPPTVGSQRAVPSDPMQMANEYATRLMDELFEGVDRALDGDPEALEALEAPPAPLDTLDTKAAADLTLNFSEGGLPAVLLSETEPETSMLLQGAPATDVEAALAVTSENRWQRYWNTNRILLGAAGLALVATLSLWLYQRQHALTTATATAPAPAEVPTATPQTEFLEYLRRSLNVIGQNASPSTSVSPVGISNVPVPVNGGSVSSLPPVASGPALGGADIPPAHNGPVQVIERIYVPYPATAAPAPTAIAAPSPTNGPIANSAPIAAAPVHTLLGVLELGDRSAALFEIDGVPQRVYIGEGIGGSGWSLVSVGNEEAVMRRNGEVRSIYIGQQF